jgi:hypothetical protein
VTEGTRRPVQTEVVVLPRPGAKGTAVYAFGGWGRQRALARARAALARQRYRRRFGIETSYRQPHEGPGRTTAKDAAYRPPPVGLGLPLRQVRVWLTAALARSRRARPSAWLGELPLRRLLGWLAEVLRGKYPETKRIDPGQPLPTLEGLKP